MKTNLYVVAVYLEVIYDMMEYVFGQKPARFISWE